MQEHRLGDFDPAAVERDIQQENSKSGTPSRIFDAATTVIRITTMGHAYSAEFYALRAQSERYPNIRMLQDLSAIEERLSQIFNEVRGTDKPPSALASAPKPALLVTSRVAPEYTPEARAAGLQGTVLLSLDVKPDGAVKNVRVRRGLGMGLDERAVAAIQQWQYRPFNPEVGPMMDVVELPFESGAGGQWRVVGSSLAVRSRNYRSTPPVLTAYVAPDARACNRRLLTVPVELEIASNGKPTRAHLPMSIEDAIGKAAVNAVVNATAA